MAFVSVRGLSLVGFGLVLFTWRYFTPEGPRLPSVMGVFYLCFNSLALARLASCLQKKHYLVLSLVGK